jgi:hypothetical protein
VHQLAQSAVFENLLESNQTLLPKENLFLISFSASVQIYKNNYGQKVFISEDQTELCDSEFKTAWELAAVMLCMRGTPMVGGQNDEEKWKGKKMNIGDGTMRSSARAPQCATPAASVVANLDQSPQGNKGVVSRRRAKAKICPAAMAGSEQEGNLPEPG